MKKNDFLCIVLVICAILLLLSNESFADIVSKRHVVVEQSDEIPTWKTKWDEVRELVRQNKFHEAANGYSELLNMKSNIEEARWEYLQLLIRLDNWELASNLAGSLLEENPYSVDYRLSGGQIALERGKYERAMKYFGWVFAREPNSTFGLTALKGMIEALQGLGRHEKAFALMEQLYVRKFFSSDLLNEMAKVAMQLGLKEKAAHYFSILIEKFPVDDRIIFQAANIYSQMGNGKKAASYWEMYLTHHPEYLPFQKKISDYYLLENKKKQALPHLIVLLEKGERSTNLLLQIGEIYLHELKRPDKALVFLQEYAQKNSGNEDVQKEIEGIRTVLANDLLSIVENDGAWRLWKDLAQLTPDRVAIYLSMIDVLDRLGREDELKEIVDIIHRNDPDNQEALLHLATIEFKKNRLKTGLEYFEKVSKNAVNKEKYLTVQAMIYEIQGQELKALETLEEYLCIHSNDRDILQKCFRLSGQLGLVHKMKKHFKALGNLVSESSLVCLEIQYLKYLRENHMFQESENIYNDLMRRIGNNSEEVSRQLLAKADYLSYEGLTFEAEQILRRVFISNVDSQKALNRLVELSIREKELAKALAWFSLFRGHATVLQARNVNLLNQDPEVTFLQAKILNIQEKDDEAIYLLEEILNNLAGNDEKRKLKKKVALFLMSLYLKTRQYEVGIELGEKIEDEFPDELETIVLSRRMRGNISEKKVEDKDFSEITELAKYEMKHGDFQNGLNLIEKAVSRVRLSVKARAIKALLLRKDGQYSEALKVFRELQAEMPENQFFIKNILEIEYVRGNPSHVVESFYKSSSLEEGRDGYNRGFETWWKLLTAKSLQTMGRRDEAFDIYDSMLKKPVEDILIKRIKDADISFNLPRQKKLLMNTTNLSLTEKISLSDTVMSPSFVGKHIGKFIDIVSTELYAEYRWQKLIRREQSISAGKLGDESDN